MTQVVVVGSVALDSIETPYGHENDILGGSATFFSISASYFCNVGLVGVVGSDFPPESLDIFNRRKIDLSGFQKAEGNTFRWSGYYSDDLNTAHTRDTQLNVFAQFSPVLPEHYKSTQYLFLGNIDPELQLAVMEQVKRPQFIACDTMNFWIQGKRAALLKTLEKIDCLLINDSEARALAQENNLVKAMRSIHEMGPTILVVKQGEYGALLSSPDGLYMSPALPLEIVKDPTGAGDTFAGGFMGTIARTGNWDEKTLRCAVRTGCTMASFTVEHFGTKGIETLKTDDLRVRYNRLCDLSAPLTDASVIWP
jgi:sugar/nucleoside kinase (ribokinase family)